MKKDTESKKKRLLHLAGRASVLRYKHLTLANSFARREKMLEQQALEIAIAETPVQIIPPKKTRERRLPPPKLAKTFEQEFAKLPKEEQREVVTLLRRAIEDELGEKEVENERNEHNTNNSESGLWATKK